jgi:hypothetical protein
MAGKGRLYGQDCEWKEYEVVGGEGADLILNENEAAWLRAYWSAATAFRRPATTTP